MATFVHLLIENRVDKGRANSMRAAPVFVLYRRGHLTVRLLIQKGAGEDTATGSGATPVFVASQKGSPYCV